MSGQRKPPKKIQVGNVTYKIVIDSGLFYEKIAIVDDLDLIGYCDIQAAKIYLKPGLALDIERDTLCHELAHAVWSSVGIGETTGSEEYIICAFLPAYMDTIVRNPKLRKYLFND